MTPVEEARAMCEELGYDFEEKRTYFEQTGYTYVGQDCLIFAKPVAHAWWVWLAVGPNALQRFCELVPYPLPQVAFAREKKGRSETKLYSFQRFETLAKFNHGRKTSKTYGAPPSHPSSHSDLGGCGERGPGRETASLPPEGD